MAYFHYRCGERITLLNDNCTAVRSDSDFDNGLVITAEPLVNDVLFEIKIDRKVNSWSGSLEVGVVDCDPLHFDFPACASKIQNPSWILAGTSLFRSGNCIIERYSTDLDKLGQDDKLGVMRTSEGDLIFYVNGESQGVASENLPNTVYAIVDVYGKCVQVSVTSPNLREHNNDDCLSGSSVLAIDNDILNVTLGGDLSELSMSSSNSLDIRMDMNVSLPEECPRPDKLRFHDRCGSLVKLSNCNRTAERRRPLDEFNNGVVMTHRPLRDSELFEIRIDRLVDKWSGSIEMGITTHNPSTLVFPATMTNMRSGTIMMSGCGILTNGKGTRREYGDFNLDELSEGDRVGMMRKPDGNLHYFINGLDQGVAAQRVPSTVWGVIDLYGMTIKVSIVERDEREEQNLMTRKNTRECPELGMGVAIEAPPAYYDRLTFHPNCGTHAQVVNNGRTAHRPNAADDFNNGVVLTARPLKTGELFEVRLDRVVTKWAGSIEIGVTTHSPVELEFPFTMTNVRSGTWMMTGSGIMHNGTIVLEQYGVNLDRLQVGDRVGVVRKENGLLHFFVNGVDQGAAASNVPERIYGVIDLYGQAVEASIIDMYDYGSPDTMNSSVSNTTLYSDLRFHHVHGKNARIVNGGLTALRPRPFSEFNDAIVFSSRPLRDGELFEVCLDSVVDRWSGSIELGVTAVRPDDIDLPGTATDLCRDTWMLSGSSVMENGITVKTNYPCDLDALSAGIRIGVVRTADKTLEFYKDGVSQGLACIVPNSTIYAVIDLYGQCAQVSIPCVSPVAGVGGASLENCARSDTSASLQAASVVQPSPPHATDLHLFSEFHGKGVSLSEGGRSAKRGPGIGNTLVYSALPLLPDEPFEITITGLADHMAGGVAVGVTESPPGKDANLEECIYITGNELRNKNKIVHHFTPSLHWLTLSDRISLIRTQDATLKIYVNGEELPLHFPQLPEITTPLFVVVDLRGQCSGVAATSHRAPPPSPMHDSLDEGEAATAGLVPSNVVNYEFCENHGRNVEVVEGRKSARRVASYNRGVVIVQPPFEIDDKVEITVEQLDDRWEASLIVGVVAGPADRLHLPINALAFKPPCCIIAEDWINVNGAKTRSNYGKRLADLKISDKVGVVMSKTGIRLVVNDEEEEELNFSGGVGMHAVFDLYGKCQQIKLVSEIDDLEKADLECCEKEHLTLPLPSTSMTTSLVSTAPSTPLKNTTCQFKEDCLGAMNRLLLPERYFATEGPTCFCSACGKNGEKDNLLIGWVRFPLPAPTNPTTEKWHVAFYPTTMGAVRCILDTGQPLTKGQSQFGNLIIQKEDDVQVVFYPSLQNCKEGKGYKIQGGKVVHVAFQLLVKPGAYSVSREEWSTKETGAIVLRALLIHVSTV